MSDVAKEIVEGKDILRDVLTKLYKNMTLKRIRMPERFSDVSKLWLRDAPFYSEFMMRFNFFETEGIDTFAVNCIDGRINLYFNPKFLNGGSEHIKFDPNTGKPILKKRLGSPIRDKDGNFVYEKEIWPGLKTTDEGNEVEAILVHEIMHLVLLTQERALDDADMWNIASDMIINDMITKMNIGGRDLPLPKGGVYLADARKLGYAGPDVTEDLYHWLIQKRSQMASKSKTCSKCGGSGEQECSSCGGTGKDKKGKPCPDCGGTGKETCDQCNGHGEESDELFDEIFKSRIDDHSLLRDNDNLTESILEDIVKCAQSKGYGSISGQGLETLKELVKPPKINWKRELRQALSSQVHGHGSNRTESWMKPNRRGLPLPGNRRLENEILVGIDTSGSIGSEELEQFFAEIEAIVRDFSKLTIIQWDTEIKDINTKYKRGKWRDIQIKGRGGTDPQGVFNWIEENNKYNSTIVMLTDGDFSYKFNPFRAKIIWCVTEQRYDPPHGRVIHLNIAS